MRQNENREMLNIEKIIQKAMGEKLLLRDEIIHLLSLENCDEIELLFRAARDLRKRYFKNKVFLYGFIYFSTYCRNNCRFCACRRSNFSARRYRKQKEEVLEAALCLAESGVHLIDLTMGEDPFFFAENGFEFLLEQVKRVKEETSLPIMISPGVVPDVVLKRISEMGVEWYASYQETHNPRLFAYLRPQQDYWLRMNRKRLARRLGLLIEEGILTGIGDSPQDRADSIEGMRELGAHQVRVMSFIPQEGTPLSSFPSPPRIQEMKMIAVLRLCFPERLIPASLDIDGIKNLRLRLDAGANVITSLVPPLKGLSGVSQATLDIDEGYRSVRGVLPILQECGLEPASVEEYCYWIRAKKNEPQKEINKLEARP